MTTSPRTTPLTNRNKNPDKLNHFSSSINQISVFHYNIQSAFYKMIDLESFFHSMRIKPHFIVLTEHWLHAQSLDFFSINGLIPISYYCRNQNEHGGVMVLAGNDVGAESVPVDSFKYVCELAVIYVPKMDLAIAGVYRSPNADFEDFLDHLEGTLLKLLHLKKKAIILGDFNVHFEDDNDFKAKSLTRLLLSYGFRDTVSFNTRGERRLDNIFVNWDNVFEIIALEPCLSDHSAQQCSWTEFQDGPPSYNLARCIRPDSFDLINTILKMQDFNFIYNRERDINLKWKMFLDIITYTYNMVCPLMPRKAKKINKFDNRWYTEDLRKLAQLISALHNLNKLMTCQYTKERLKVLKKKPIKKQLGMPRGITTTA